MKSKVTVDCKTKMNVSTGDDTFAYAYNCCLNSDDYQIMCDVPDVSSWYTFTSQKAFENTAPHRALTGAVRVETLFNNKEHTDLKKT